MGELPWKRVYDYILETEGHTTLSDFYQKAMTGMNGLIPFDEACVVQCNLNGTRIEAMDTLEIEPGNKNAYLQYYHQYDCFKKRMAETEKITDISWHEYRHSHFYTDFIQPQRIQYSLGVALRDRASDRITALVLHRAGRQGFSDRDLEIASAVQPHLSYLFALFNRTILFPSEMQFAMNLVFDGKLLSKRETEVIKLLLQRMTFPEIAARMGLSVRTVEFHITNIYRKLNVKNRKELLLKLDSWKNADRN